MDSEKAKEIFKKQANEPWMKNLEKGKWGNALNVPGAENDLPVPAPSVKPATYKAKTQNPRLLGKTYLPEASRWVNKGKTMRNANSRARTPNSLSKSNLENIEKSRQEYLRRLPPSVDEFGREIPRSRPRRSHRSSSRHSRRHSRRHRSSSRQSRRHRSSSRHSRRHRSSSRTRHSSRNSRRHRSSSRRRRSPSVNEFGRNLRYSRRSHRRSHKPRRRGPRFYDEESQTYKRPVGMYNNATGTYVPR